MKHSIRRTLLILLALILLLTLPLSGCGRIREVVSRAVSRVTEVLSDSTGSPQSGLKAARPDDSKQDGLIPLDEIFAATEYISPVLSGDGKYVMYRHIRPDGSADDIVVRNMKTGMETIVPFPPETNGIPYYQWSGDSRHVLFMIDNGGDENYSIYAVEISSGKSRAIYSRKGATAYIAADDSENPNGIYFECNGRNTEVFDLHWADIATGETHLVMENPGDVVAWYFDHGSVLRAVKVTDDDGGERILTKKEGVPAGTAFMPGDWRQVIHWGYNDVDTSGFLGFSVDGKRIHYLDSTGRNTAAVMEMDLATGSVKAIYSDPAYDASGIWHDLTKDRVTAVHYSRERSGWKALEDDIGRQVEYVSSLSSGDWGFASTSNDDRYWLIHFDSDTEGRSYYFVDAQQLKSSYLFHEVPMLQKYNFAPMEPIEFMSSDGLEIHGYATFPLGAERKDLPMVLFVHGGPKARDTWGFNGEVQWLANRGYLVLQVNFRGSTGYGKRFIAAGDREWGGKMQQDLTDAVNWAVGKGYANRDRVAIMGASYGGYAALAGAAFTPDVYACAIDMFGPSSLITMANSVPGYWKPYQDQMFKSIGNPATDGEFMKSRSPLYHVGNIKIPVLIAQGGNDVRVTPQESEQIVNAMREKGLSVKYMFFPNAGHGFNTNEDYYSFFSEAEKFLAEHIGGKTEN